MLFPGERVLRVFEDTTRPLYQRIVTCDAECRILAKLRDLLLPKLLSGEIRVKEAERIAGKAI